MLPLGRSVPIVEPRQVRFYKGSSNMLFGVSGSGVIRKHSDVGADSGIPNYRGAHIHGNLNKASLNGAPLNSGPNSRGKWMAFPIFSSMDGMDAMLENGPWFILNTLFILKKWNPDVNLLKEDVGNVSIWVKFHGVPMMALSEDGLSAISTKLGTPLMLDSYTSEIWKIFGHVPNDCPKNLSSDVAKNLKNPRQADRGVAVGHKVGFKPVKQVFRQGLKNTSNTSGKKKQDRVPRQEAGNSNPFDALNSIKNDNDLGTNGRNSNSARNGSLHVAHGSSSDTPIIDKINKLVHQIFDGKVMFMDDDRKPIVPTNNVDSDSDGEVEVVFYETETLMASTSFKSVSDRGCGTNSLLEQ
ncbi:ARID DNA-binding domain-containing protein [Tanacetum coccineum]